LNAVHLPQGAAISDHVHAAFLAALPIVLKVARFRFRRVPCSDTREDCICETVALCWVWYIRLVRKGRNPAAFIATPAKYGATAVISGRRVCGQEKANYLLSRRCQRRREFTVWALSETATMTGDMIEQAMRDNTRTPVLDQVQFRCDFPAWKERLTVLKQQIVDRLALGHRTKDLAQEFGLSAGRISQLRKELFTDYLLFCESLADD